MPQTDTATARYVKRVLDLYRRTPGTSGRARPADRRLAATLCSRRIPIATVETALLLAVARRNLRPTGAPQLPRIATLHYFLPLIDELLAAPPDAAYLHYLRARLAAVAPALVSRINHQVS
jgi:hypothetical protein